MKILIVDDEKNQREALAGFIDEIGHNTFMADSAQSALKFLHTNSIDVVLTDYKMPYMTGSDLLKEINSRHPTIVVILTTAFGTIDIAVEAMRNGAWDFLSKPVDLDNLEQQLLQIEQHLHTYRKSKTRLERFQIPIELDGMIVRDSEMQRIYKQIKKIANSKASVLITGDTGTGKEVVAHQIHQESPLKDKPMISVNCAALPSNLIESELFGHVKGAFTGANKDRKGRFEEATNSTLFLDEIGDLPLQLQVKLLRFLQDGVFEKVGSNIPIESKARIVAATNIDLDIAVEQGNFREDLLYRLNVIHFKVPSLKERPDDILPLAELFLHKIIKRDRLEKIKLSKEAVHTLLEYSYPGNIRELKNIIERAALLCDNNVIQNSDLVLKQFKDNATEAGSLNVAISDLEKEMIQKELIKASGNQSACARKLGVSERVLRYKLEKYKLR